MKKAKDIYEYYKEINGLNYCEGLDGVFELMKAAQKDAIEATLVLAAEKAIVEITRDGYYEVDKDSILSLKDELFAMINK